MTTTPLSSIEIFRRALPGRLPEAPSIYETLDAVRQVRDCLAGIQPADLSREDAETIRREAAKAV